MLSHTEQGGFSVYAKGETPSQSPASYFSFIQTFLGETPFPPLAPGLFPAKRGDGGRVFHLWCQPGISMHFAILRPPAGAVTIQSASLQLGDSPLQGLCPMGPPYGTCPPRHMKAGESRGWNSGLLSPRQGPNHWTILPSLWEGVTSLASYHPPCPVPVASGNVPLREVSPEPPVSGPASCGTQVLKVGGLSWGSLRAPQPRRGLGVHSWGVAAGRCLWAPEPGR